MMSAGRSLNIAKHKGSLGVVVIATLVTLLLTVWMGYDFRYFSSAPIGDQGDTLQDTWALYQGMDNLLHRPFDLGYSTIFYNDPASFAYTTAPYGAALTTLPIYLLTKNLELTHNIYFIAIWVLTAWAAYLLIKYLLNPPWIIALVGALMIDFSQYRVVHIIHIFELCAFLVLFCLLCLHHLIDAPKIRWAVGLAASFFFTILTSGYLGMMFVFTGGIILLYSLVKGKLTARFFPYFVAAGILAGILVAPFIVFRFANTRFRQGQTYDEVLIQSSTVEELFSGSSVIYRGVTPIGRATGEAGVFFGFVPLILAALAWRWRADADGADIDIAAAADQRAFTIRETIVLYAIVTLATYLIVLGPVIRFGGKNLIPDPFLLLMQFPGFSGFRALSRFILIAIISTAMLSVYALTALLKRLNENAYLTFFLIVVVAFTVESIPYNGAQADGEIPTKKIGDALRLAPDAKRLFPIPQQRTIPVYQWLAKQPPGTAIFEYPADIKYSYQYLMDVQLHNQPMLNGSNVAYYPDWFIHTDWDAFPTVSIMNLLLSHNIHYILVHRENMTAANSASFQANWQQFQEIWGPIPLVGHFGTVDVYQVTASQPLSNIFFKFDTLVPGDGWYQPARSAGNALAAWTGPGEDSTLHFKVAADRDATISFTIQQASSPEVLASMQLSVNGVPIALTSSTNPDATTTFAGTIPQTALARASSAAGQGESLFTFHVDHLQPSYPETRGVLMKWVWIRSIAPPSAIF